MSLSEIIEAVVHLEVEGLDASFQDFILDPRVPRKDIWGGSGFFVTLNGTDRFILTNAHVAQNAERIHMKSVLTSDEEFRLRIAGIVKDIEPDVALLEFSEGERERFEGIAGERVPVLRLGDSDPLKRGEPVKAIGYPLGMETPNVSGGEVSNFIEGDSSSCERLVADAAINPGNSGGPCINEKGEAIGVNTSIIAGANNIGFITPISHIKQLLNVLAGGGDVGIVQLGCDLQHNSVAVSRYLGQEKVEGVIVSKIYDGSFLEKLGMRDLDVILKVQKYSLDRFGKVISKDHFHRKNIFDLIHRVPVGDRVCFEVFRQGQILTLEGEARPFESLTLLPKPLIQHRRFIEMGGMIVQELYFELANSLTIALGINFWSEIPVASYSTKKLLVISCVDSDSRADEAFLQEGDLIAKVNGTPVESLEDFVEQAGQSAQNGGSVMIQCYRGNIGVFDLVDGQGLEIKKATKP